MGSLFSKNKALILAPVETPMVEDHLCLWFLDPVLLKALLVLNFTEGSATPVPMDCLRICTDLWTPDLWECILIGREHIDDSVVFEVAQLCPDLSSLDVSNSIVTDTALKAVAVACPLLSSLNVGGTNKITDEGIMAIAASCHMLASLDVSGTGKVSDEGIEAIAASCPALTSLDVWGTGGRITDKGIKAIAASCPALTSLNVRFTEGKVTNEGIHAIVASCPALTSLDVSNQRENIKPITVFSSVLKDW